jgi:hypothetical protein
MNQNSQDAETGEKSSEEKRDGIVVALMRSQEQCETDVGEGSQELSSPEKEKEEEDDPPGNTGVADPIADPPTTLNPTTLCPATLNPLTLEWTEDKDFWLRSSTGEL